MVLKDVNLGHEVKCTCELCRGTGIYKGQNDQDGLAVVCVFCNGEGYYTLKLNKEVQLVKEEQTGVIYKVKGGMIDKPVELFHGRKKRDDVSYVMYGTDHLATMSAYLEKGATKDNIIKYQDFLDGMLPIPMSELVCPQQFMQYYGRESFFDDCPPEIGSFSECDKHGTEECWDRFYGNAATPDEIQAVLRKVKR